MATQTFLTIARRNRLSALTNRRFQSNLNRDGSSRLAGQDHSALSGSQAGALRLSDMQIQFALHEDYSWAWGTAQ